MKKLLILLLITFCGCATRSRHTRAQEQAAYEDGYKCGMYMSQIPIMRHHYWPKQYELKALKDAWYRGYYDGLGYTTPDNWDKQP